MAGLSLRNNVWYITYRNEEGKPRRISTDCKTPDKIGAEIKRREFEEAQRLGRIDPYLKHRKQPLSSHVDDYYDYQIAKQLTQKQADGVRMRINRLFDMADVKCLQDISESRLQVALSKLRRVPSSPDKREEDMPFVSPRTRNIYLRSVLSFCRWMVRDKRMPDNPLSAMEMENESVDVRHARSPLTDEEFAKLYETALRSEKTVEGYDGETRAMAYLITISTGLRRNELASLTRRSFQLDGHDPTLVVEAAYSKHRRRDVIRIAKGLLPVLRPWLNEIPQGEAIFPLLARRKSYKIIRVDLEAAGISYRTSDGKFRDWHALRHSFITRAWRSGAQPNVVKDLARHSDIRETLAYSHSSQSDLRKAVDNIPPLPLNGIDKGE